MGGSESLEGSLEELEGKEKGEREKVCGGRYAKLKDWFSTFLPCQLRKRDSKTNSKPHAQGIKRGNGGKQD